MQEREWQQDCTYKIRTRNNTKPSSPASDTCPNDACPISSALIGAQLQQSLSFAQNSPRWTHCCEIRWFQWLHCSYQLVPSYVRILTISETFPQHSKDSLTKKLNTKMWMNIFDLTSRGRYSVSNGRTPASYFFPKLQYKIDSKKWMGIKALAGQSHLIFPLS